MDYFEGELHFRSATRATHAPGMGCSHNDQRITRPLGRAFVGTMVGGKIYGSRVAP
jgi:hypothetical protein